MKTTQGNLLLSLQNAQAFLRENTATLGAVTFTGALRMLDDAIAELSDHAAVQNGETRAATSALARRRALRVALRRDHMAPIARIARLELRNTPELVSLGLPKGQPTTERLAALADGMVHAAEPFAPVFINAGMRPDFIPALRAAADAMLQALLDRTQSKGKVRTATTALRNKLAHGRRIVHVLDAFITSALAEDPDLLAGWKLVKRVPQPRTAAAPIATPSTPTAAAAAPPQSLP